MKKQVGFVKAMPDKVYAVKGFPLSPQEHRASRDTLIQRGLFPQRESVKWHIMYCVISICPQMTIISVPAPMRIQPISDFAVKSSWRNTKASIRVITVLSLSMGTTFETSPICRAL